MSIFVFVHEPVFPSGKHIKDGLWYNDNDPDVLNYRDKLWEAFCKNEKVVAVLGSHDHCYYRTLINKDTPVYLNMISNSNFTCPIWQIVSGGAGAPIMSSDMLHGTAS
jgi:hypothetical protein